MSGQNNPERGLDGGFLVEADVDQKKAPTVVDKKFLRENRLLARFQLEDCRAQLRGLEKAKEKAEALARKETGGDYINMVNEIVESAKGRIRLLEIALVEFADAEARNCPPQN
jgi:hypothetical protein